MTQNTTQQIKNIMKIGLVGLLLSGCKPQIDSGVVLEKHYEPATTYQKVMQGCNGKGFVVYTVKVNRDEAHIFTIGKYQNGEMARRKIFATKEIYDSVNTNDLFSPDKYNDSFLKRFFLADKAKIDCAGDYHEHYEHTRGGIE